MKKIKSKKQEKNQALKKLRAKIKRTLLLLLRKSDLVNRYYSKNMVMKYRRLVHDKQGRTGYYEKFTRKFTVHRNYAKMTKHCGGWKR